MLYFAQAFVKALLKYRTHTLEKIPVLLTREFFLVGNTSQLYSYKGFTVVVSTSKYFELSLDNNPRIMYNFKNILQKEEALDGLFSFCKKGQVRLDSIHKNKFGRRIFHSQKIFCKGKEVLT